MCSWYKHGWYLKIRLFSQNRRNLNLAEGEIFFEDLPKSPYDIYNSKEDASSYIVQSIQTRTIPPKSEGLILCQIMGDHSTQTQGIMEPTLEFLSSHGLEMLRY